jgi:hypothetical protein
MTFEEYTDKITEIGFEEFPYIILGGEKNIGDIVDYDKASLELKIHLAKVTLCLCFSPTGGIYIPANCDWFISNFFQTYDKDVLKPWLTTAIKTASEMISSDNFNGIIGTTFMFGVIEFYVKHKLGFRPNEYDFFDNNKKNYFRELNKDAKSVRPELSLGKAFEFLQQKDFPISHSLNEIDKHNNERLQELGIEEKRWVKVKIADRLSLARNAMLHGEQHFFYDKGKYLVMLYILFHLNEQKENNG